MNVNKIAGLALVALLAPLMGFAAKDPAAQREAYRKTGGMIERPGTAKGVITIVNAQKRLPAAWLENTVRFVEKKYRYKFKVVTLAAPVALADAKPTLVANGAAFGVVVTVLDAKLPPLTVFPDEQCAVINAAAMPEDEAAFRKQVSRAFACACGAFGSQYQTTLMGPFSNTKKLAAYPVEGLPADVIVRVKNTLRDNGVRPYIPTTYKAACREGWAPDPGTNEVWRAIWEAAKSEKERGPANALEIKPPKK